MDFGWLIHSGVTVVLLALSVFLPAVVFIPLFFTVMWFAYEYGQAHMRARLIAVPALKLPWNWGFKKHSEWIVPALVALVFALWQSDIFRSAYIVHLVMR